MKVSSAFAFQQAFDISGLTRLCFVLVQAIMTIDYFLGFEENNWNDKLEVKRVWIGWF